MCCRMLAAQEQRVRPATAQQMKPIGADASAGPHDSATGLSLRGFGRGALKVAL